MTDLFLPRPPTLMVADITCRCGAGFLATGDAAVSLAAMPYHLLLSAPHRVAVPNRQARRLPSDDEQKAFLAAAAPHATIAGWRRDDSGRWWCPADVARALPGEA